MSTEALTDLDRRLLWHPYGRKGASDVGPPPLPVASASGVRLTLTDGRELIDGMSSWWAAIHGYRHPVLDAAVTDQLGRMAHVMFGGLTHEPAVRLAQQLVEITPEPLSTVFLADSGSVSVEVAIKMALQYWRAQGRDRKHRLLTWRGGYHGDTFAPMSVCDPTGGMHSLWTDVLAEQIFVSQPPEVLTEDYVAEIDRALHQHRDEVAAVIVEPLVQGAGGMRFHDPALLTQLRSLCDEHDVLLIFDEIATGFGRTGHLFAATGAGVSPDIMCVGKALTGGYLTMAATLCTEQVARVISESGVGVLAHGPTFMGNPLACAVSLASVQLLVNSPWQQRVRQIETGLQTGLAGLIDHPHVVDVRVRGAIGVVELAAPVDMVRATDALVAAGVWLRPFRNLIYTMPPFICDDADIATICHAIGRAVDSQ